jgi:hypothetical protein
MTSSLKLKAKWVGSMSPKQILALIRPLTEGGQMNFSLLALCSDDLIATIKELLSSKQKKQWIAW